MAIYNPERAKLRRMELIDKGICYRCGRRPHVTEGGICDVCREYHRRHAQAKLIRFRLTNPPKKVGSKPGVKRGPYKPRFM